jgi:signal transduction histidine kinase
VWAITLFFVVAGVALTFVDHATMDGNTTGLYVILLLSAIAFSTVGGLIARRQAANPIGWLFCVMGFAAALLPFAQEYAVRGRFISPGSLPGADFFGFATNWLFLLAVAPTGLVFLLFPGGSPLTSRWRIAVWVAGASTGVFVAAVFLSPDVASGTGGYPGRLTMYGGDVRNPLGLQVLGRPAGPVGWLVPLIVFMSAIFGVVSLFLRWRRATGVERQQIRWLAYAGTSAVVLLPLLPLSAGLHNNVIGGLFWYGLIGVLTLGIPIASGVAILRYRLYDLDVIVKKTVVVGALVAFATAVYLAVVVGVGAAIGNRSNPALTLVASAIVAMAFQPLRTRARRVADRLVYGERATPYEVLSEFSDRLSANYSTDDVLPRMAELLAKGTGATRAGVWLRVRSEARLTASWPRGDAEEDRRTTMPLEELERLPGGERSFAVRHLGKVLGALTVATPPAEPLTPDQERLIGDLAAQAGLLLRNVGLIEELKASRQRLVTAQDEERRRLERNIHDGAQQQLVALQIKLGLARKLASTLPDAETLLSALQEEAQTALEDLRDLARGIYPPLLADQGLATALEAQVRRAALPVTVHADSIGRYPQETEAAVYFCSLEALQNVAKYANANEASLSLRGENGSLVFEVVDDGAGFDPAVTSYGTGLQGMSDRLEALGGSLQVVSGEGRGTRVIGRLPIS